MACSPGTAGLRVWSLRHGAWAAGLAGRRAVQVALRVVAQVAVLAGREGGSVQRASGTPCFNVRGARERGRVKADQRAVFGFAVQCVQQAGDEQERTLTRRCDGQEITQNRRVVEAEVEAFFGLVVDHHQEATQVPAEQMMWWESKLTFTNSVAA